MTNPEQIEKHLQQSLKELRDLKFAIDEASIVAVTDQRGLITYANKQFCEISKYSVDELLGQDHRIINSGYHPKSFIRNLWQTISQGKVWKGELRNRAKDGSLYWVDTTIVPFLNKEKKPYRYVAIRHDITHRKRVEQRLALEQAVVHSFTETSNNSKQALEKILNTISFHLDACFCELFLLNENNVLKCEALWSSGDFPLDSIQKAALEMESGARAGLLADARKKRKSGVHASVLKSPLFTKLDEGQKLHLRGTIGFPISYNRKTLGIIHVFSHEMLYEDEGLLNTLHTVGNQIGEFLVRKRMETELQTHETRLKYFEEQLRQGEKLMLLGMLASEIAHEVGTPLNIISGRVELLSSKEMANETAKRDLEIINQQIERITKIIRSRLDITRRRTGTTMPIKLKALVLSLAEFLQPQLEKNQIVMRTELSSEFSILADEDQLQQVFLNIFLNAIQAIEQGGKITVRQKMVVRDGTRYYDIQVKDTGKGIAPEALSLIFEPFYTSKRDLGGTGLGLPVVKQVLKSHGGDIYAESKQGHGATIHVLLPKREG